VRGTATTRAIGLAPLGLAAGLLLGGTPPAPDLALRASPADLGPAIAPPEIPAGAPPAMLAPAAVPALPAVALTRAVQNLRKRDCAAAGAQLDPLATGGGDAARFALLLQGLYAHACEDAVVAEEKLAAAAESGGPLDDWRLFVLADSAAASDHLALAEAALTELLGAYPGSNLAPRAVARAAAFAWRRHDAPRALELVELGRRQELVGPPAAELETLAWQVGSDLGDAAVRAAAARRLLVESPLEAKSLGVAEAYRRPGGDVDWTALLSADDLRRRAASFLALDMTPAALATLALVAPADRGEPWRLLEAQALTADHRGLAALALLADAAPASAEERAEVEWARALAALDAATAYRGRQNLPSADREKLRRAALQHLRGAAAPEVDGARQARALRRLFTELSDDGPFDDVMDVLRRLRQADREDASGARYLWDRGWSQYAARNYSGAVGYWTELAALYPESRYARAGRYWTARSFDALGDPERARRLFVEVAGAGTTDFYRKYALDRLGGKAPAADGATTDGPRGPWPEDPALARARLLTDLGLDDLAIAEIDAVGGRAEPRAARALTALARARRGERTESIAEIRRAFPTLGGPFQMRLPREALRIYYPLDYEEVVRTHAELAHLPLDLVFAVIRQESAFDPRAKSRAGARGLMQVMPRTGRELALRMGLPWSTSRLVDPEFNLRLGTTYLRQVLEMFGGNLDLALAGYNGGPFRVKRLWAEAGADRELDRFLEGLAIEESKTYVKRILVLADSYRQLYPEGRRDGESEL